MTYQELINCLAAYLRNTRAELGSGRMSLRYSRQLARGLIEQLTLNDLDALQALFL